MITFTKLSKEHLPLLLNWLESPHVKAWWDQDVVYDASLVNEKFGKHIGNVSIDNGQTIAFIILCDNKEIGYIQYYDAANWLNENKIDIGNVKRVAGIDLFIGEESYYCIGLGSMIIDKFCQEFIELHFDNCIVDPVLNNIRAIKSYNKAGFKVYREENNICWMIR